MHHHVRYHVQALAGFVASHVTPAETSLQASPPNQVPTSRSRAGHARRHARRTPQRSAPPAGVTNPAADMNANSAGATSAATVASVSEELHVIVADVLRCPVDDGQPLMEVCAEILHHVSTPCIV